MGGWMSRRNSDAEEQDAPTPTAFRYPPKSGNYFNSHFIMGGERFETPQPEQYLFGDNSDLNFLGSKPVPFPYPAPQSNEPTKTLKALINIRKETLKFVKIPVVPLAASDSAELSDETSSAPQPLPTPATKPPTTYNIEFIFDADCKCEITIMYFCTEEVTSRGVRYRPRDPKISAEPIRFKAGANQVYTNTLHTFNPVLFPETDLQYDFEKEVFPVVIQCVSMEDGTDIPQSHITTATVDKYSDGSYSLKAMKQKLFVDGILYLLQEIYGIENKNACRKLNEEEDVENSAECVICMSDIRDTLILPCRHLCLCHSCADSLRYQANNCPICRSPFRALLQIRAVYRIPPAPMEYPALTSEMPVVQMNSIPGYEMVPLLEALNGPYPITDLPSSAAATVVVRQEAARALNPCEETNDRGMKSLVNSSLNSSARTRQNHETFPGIPMTVMVAPSMEETDQEDSEKSHVVFEVERKESIVKLSKSGSIDTKTLTSDPEDEEHFSEAPDQLPDCQDFVHPGETIRSRYSLRSRIPDVDEEEEEALQLQSIESSHSNILTMIAAIDEFSDEEEDSRGKSASASGGLMSGTGRDRLFLDSTQSTPQRSVANEDKSTEDSPEPNHRYSRTIPSSLPGTPNVRSSMSAGTNPTSLRSSGDSFTSSSSTKQLLPPTTTHQN